MLNAGRMVHVKRTDSRDATTDPTVDLAVGELERIVRHQRRGMVRDRHRLPMSLAHLHTLMVLDADGAVPMNRLAEGLACSMPNATGIIDRMEERGLVERLRDELDRRLVLVRITQAGCSALGEFEMVRQHHMRRILAAMSSDDQHLCLDAFRRIRETAEQLDQPPTGAEA